jgi:sortase A
MKQKLPIIGIVIILLTGICVLSYPLFSSVLNNLVSRSQAEEYSSTVKAMSSEETLALLQQAYDYNNSLTNNVIITDPFDEEAYEKIGANYENALNVDNNGLIGYVDIPKINVYLPIRHGTSSEVLAHSAGHLMNTSLPVGGESTHAIISAHSAYPGETFFDYLTDMEIGDEFYIHVLDRTLKYEVDKISVILPEEVDEMRIINGEDHVTLLTCTPYSINTHRLLVRGVRVDYDDSEYITTGSSLVAFQDYIYFLGYKIPYWAAGTFIGVVIILIIIFIIVLTHKSKKSKKSKKPPKLSKSAKHTAYEKVFDSQDVTTNSSGEDS